MLTCLVNLFFISLLFEVCSSNSIVGRLTITPPDVSNHRNLHLLPQECGLVQPQKRIVAGVEANLFEFPWLARLGYERENVIRYLCLGSVITKRFILTPAHCTKPNSPVTVRLGEYNVTSDPDCVTESSGVFSCAPPVQDILVKRVSRHPKYDYRKLENDIALVQLISDIQYNDAVSPICLPVTRTAINSPLTIAGWGAVDKLHLDDENEVLLKAKVQYVTPTYCKSFLTMFGHYSFEEKRLCASYGGSDSCKGDSGSTLLTLNKFDNELKYVQIGFASFGITDNNCGSIDYPTVYTNVAEYIDKILDQLN